MSRPGLLPPAALRGRLPALTITLDEAEDAPVSRAAPAQFTDLQHALERAAPACTGDARFTTDRAALAEGDTAAMRDLCAGCPVMAPCAAYARAARPSAGTWAGITYPRPRETHDHD